MNALPWTIYLSFAAAGALLLLPARAAHAARGLALGAALAAGLCALAGALAWQPTAGWQTLVRVEWIPSLGIHYHLAADGISAVLLVLTGIASVAGVLFSWDVQDRPREFFALYLALVGGVYGVFLSADAFLFFVFYEIAIVPKYFLIAIWGSTRREFGAMKLALYSFAGSALVLLGIIAAWLASGASDFDLATLAAANYGRGFQLWVYPTVFVGFAVLAGLWPLHTWAPTGHVAAPTAASMLLAGVVMKLGAYGILRVAMPLFPEGAAAWAEAFAWLAAIGIVWAGLVALVQDDFKFVIGYSSVSHMGFVLLGLAAGNTHGVAGAVLQMFSHGVIAGLLFAVVGRMVYARTHTRDLDSLGAARLARALPFAAVTFVLAGLASMGLPGFSGFPAELSVLIGAWQAWPGLAVAAAAGIVIAGAFTLRAIMRSFFGGDEHEEGSGAVPTSEAVLPPITWPEKAGALLLLGATIAVGLRPGWLFDLILPSLETPLLRAALWGATP